MLTKRFFGFMGPRSRKVGGDAEIFSKNASQLAHLVRVVSRREKEDSRFWNQVTRRLVYIIDTISTKQLSYIANGLARARVADPETWDSIVKRHYQLQHEYDVKDLVLMANALAKVKCVENEVFQSIVQKIKDSDTAVPPRYIAVLINSMATAGYSETKVVESLLDRLDLAGSQMSVVSIAILLDGLYNLRHRNRRVLACLAERLKNVLTDPEGADVSRQRDEASVAAVGYSDTSSRLRRYVDMPKTDESTASDVSANDATRRGNDCGTVNSNPITTQQLVLIHRAYSQFAFYDKRLFDLLFRQMVLLGNKLKPLEIVIIANSMGKSKLHNKAVVDLLCKKVIAHKSGFTMDMIALFLHGICVPRDNNNNREFFTKIFEAIIENTFEGEIRAKHCLTMLQIMTKVKPTQDTCVTFFVNRLLDLRDELSRLETANAVVYITKLDANYAHLSAFVERYIYKYDKDDAIRNAQHLVILFYALSRAEGDTFDKYRNTLLELLHEIPTKYYDPMQVANILRVMATRKIHDLRLLSELSRYVEIKMQTFSPQLLSSSLQSLQELTVITTEMLSRLCQYVSKVNRRAHNRDYLLFLHILSAESSSRRPDDGTIKQDLLAAYDAIIDRMCENRELMMQNETAKDVLRHCIPKIKELRNAFDAKDVESQRIAANVAEKVMCLMEGSE